MHVRIKHESQQTVLCRTITLVALLVIESQKILSTLHLKCFVVKVRETLRLFKTRTNWVEIGCKNSKIHRVQSGWNHTTNRLEFDQPHTHNTHKSIQCCTLAVKAHKNRFWPPKQYTKNRTLSRKYADSRIARKLLSQLGVLLTNPLRSRWSMENLSLE